MEKSFWEKGLYFRQGCLYKKKIWNHSHFSCCTLFQEDPLWGRIEKKTLCKPELNYKAIPIGLIKKIVLLGWNTFLTRIVYNSFIKKVKNYNFLTLTQNPGSGDVPPPPKLYLWMLRNGLRRNMISYSMLREGDWSHVQYMTW